MSIYNMKTENMINPLGIDKEKPFFGWKMKADGYDIKQDIYRIIVSKNEDMTDIVWDSREEKSDISQNIRYNGEKLEKSTRYFWSVFVRDNNGNEHTANAFFETGLMGKDKSVWDNAKWIGSPKNTMNTELLQTYEINADFKCNKKVGFAIGARNKDNYVLIDIDMENAKVYAYEYADNAWTDYIQTVTPIGSENGYEIPEKLNDWNNIKINIENRKAVVYINGEAVIENDEFIPKNPPNRPKKEGMFLFGIKAEKSVCEFDNIKISNTEDNTVYQQDDFSDDTGILSALGRVENGRLIIGNEFNLINPVPSVNVRKIFDVSKKVKSARLYSSAMGFYDVYINGEKVNKTYYNPGFTDYRKRIYYQVYDITDKLTDRQNSIGAIVAKGYYTGTVGYSGNMIYGKKNYFIAKCVIEYTDGSSEIIVTDRSWQFTDKGSVMTADYLQGEDYDARFEFDWNDTSDKRWGDCGMIDFPEYAKATNGVLENVKFELVSQMDTGAEFIEKLMPVGDVTEAVKGHFVYDLGQNIVGSVYLKMRGRKGKSIKIRYGEMCYKDARLYVANLRTAANTDTYTFKDDNTAEFIPTLTSHGYRYVEISGNGYTLTRSELDEMILEIAGYVIANTKEKTGSFECSNKDINRLQKNIQWGQIDNSLLVYTDCPQRNERMGWTGDAQVFARTASHNYYVKAFMNKWIADMYDAQILYNRDGAMPDTAPLGGDNRKMGGCGGWGDAAVIVPWEMYRAYGDINILADNYEMMKKWVDYQSRDDRQYNGVRTVDGVEVPDKSDLSKEPFIQVQQSRGDHLTFDESTPFILSATAYSAYVAKLLSKIADILGKREDSVKYKKRFEDIKNAFCDAWVQEDGTIAYWGEMSKGVKDINGNIINKTYYSNKDASNAKPSQTAYALAIDFDLIPHDKLDGAIKAFKESIDDRGGKLSVGFLGISHLAPALTKAGLDDMAFALLEQEENPSWLYSVKNGATTIWERWNSYIAETGEFGDVNMNSFNHYSYGAIGEWIYGHILGINTSEEKGECGYKKIILKPNYGGKLTYASGCYESEYGKIKSAWEISGDEFIYNVTIPANTEAVIYLPVSEMTGSVRENVISKGESGKYFVFEAGSGEYSFRGKIH